MSSRVSVIALVAGACCAAGCGDDPRTEVIVVVDTDYPVPAELDALEIVVTSPGGEEQTGGGPITAASLPSTLGLVHESGPLGPFEVEARGLAAGAQVVVRRARFTFVPERTLVLEMHLPRACATASCGTDETCTERGCESIDVPAERLSDWTGVPPRLGEGPVDAGDVDAGDADAGDVDAGFDAGDVDAGSDAGIDACIAGPEACNMADDDCDGMVDEGLAGTPETCDTTDEDCDGMVDEGFDLMSDLMNCGACGRICVFRNGVGICTGGACVVSSCDPGFDDCDMDGSNGCETDLNASAMHCGACGNRCGPPTRMCCAGTCRRSCP